MPDVQETVTVIPGSALLWRITPRPAHSAQVNISISHTQNVYYVVWIVKRVHDTNKMVAHL